MKAKFMLTLCILSLVALAGVLYAGSVPETQPAPAEMKQEVVPNPTCFIDTGGSCEQVCADHECYSEGTCTTEGCLCTCPFG